jgi:hypothetical protein
MRVLSFDFKDAFTIMMMLIFRDLYYIGREWKQALDINERSSKIR